jgi:hypothetical protein
MYKTAEFCNGPLDKAAREKKRGRSLKDKDVGTVWRPEEDVG